MKRFKLIVFLVFSFVCKCGAQEEDFVEDFDINSLAERYFDIFASPPYEVEDVISDDEAPPDIDILEEEPPPPVETNITGSPPRISSISSTVIPPTLPGPTVPSPFLEYNLTEISARCPKDAFYSSYNPDHRSAVASLTEIFMEQSSLKDLLLFSEFSKKSPEIHTRVWYASFIRAQVIKTPSTLDLDRPSSIELFPTTFFPASILKNASGEDCALLDERIGSDNGIENKLWYFREDVQMNAHHWYWHLVNPAFTDAVIDRRGELFYFFHHELMARYTAERLSNGLKPTVPLNFHPNSVLEEGFRPHLSDGISSFPWANRRANLNISDHLNPVFQLVINDTKLFRDRVLDAINQGGLIHENGFVEIKGLDRVNLLGDLIEASNRSVNVRHYGTDGYHGLVHWIIANVDVENDPGVAGVIGDVGTAMRDSMFYRWHQYIDVVFQAYKLTHLKPYTPEGGYLPLLFRGIRVVDVAVIPENIHGENVLVNNLETFWNIRRFNLQGGLDFNTGGGSRNLNASICVKHLDHQEFYYRMHIENDRSRSVLSTIRIFMAPRYKSERQKVRFTMTEQRSLFFAMDSFQVNLQPGSNILIRRSTDSTLTAGWPKSVQRLREELASGRKTQTVCDCGFPHHLLLPKGTKSGMYFDLFLMVTEGLEDQVQNNLSDDEKRQEAMLSINDTCPPSHIHCGIPGRKYPDSRPMGYPFDRKPYEKPTLVRHPLGYQIIENRVVKNLDSYVKNIPNMHASQVIIYHRDEITGLDNLKSAKAQKLSTKEL